MQTKYDIRIEQEDISTVKKKLRITVPAEAVTEEFQKAYKDVRSTASVAGFRKGAIPLNIVKSRFGDYIEDEVKKKVIESSYIHSLQEKNYIPVEPPKVELVSQKAEEGKEFAYSITFEITPAVDIDGYRGMELKKEKIEVLDKDIDEGLENLRKVRSEFKDVERPARKGDMVVIDFEAGMNGAPLKGSKAADFQLIVGESAPIPGLSDGLVLASKGDKKDIKVTFPTDYFDKALAGKDVFFDVDVKAVKERIMPVIDDEFAKDLGCDDLANLKAKVKEELVKVKETHEKERLKNEILDKLIEGNKFEVPEALVNKYLNIILGRVFDSIRRGEGAPTDAGLTADELRARYKPVAERHVREDIILDSIAAKENLQVTTEETDKAVRHLAEMRGVTFQSLMERIQKEGALEIVKDGMKHEKVFDIILETSKPAA